MPPSPSMPSVPPTRLAIVVSHPIQYYAPWFHHLTEQTDLALKVFYLWDFGVTTQHDDNFGRSIKWDLDLLQGYESEFVPNTSPRPGTSRFSGLRNPTLSDRLRGWSPDVIMVFGYGWESMLRLAWSSPGVPLILRGDNHNLGVPRRSTLRSFLRHYFLRQLFRRYHGFACVGHANRRFYLRHGVPAGRLHHVPHAVDNARFAAATADQALAWRDRHGIPRSHLLLLFAGKLERKKRPDLLIEAFQRAALPDTTLALVGTGAMAPLVQAAAESTATIQPLGFLNQTEMPLALKAADALVLPSEGSGETWGLIVNEAMACGTPAIVSDHVGCAEDLVIPGSTGWVFPAGDVHALTHALQQAASTLRSSPTSMTTAIRHRIAEYSFTAATQGLRRLLDSLEIRRSQSRLL